MSMGPGKCFAIAQDLSSDDGCKKFVSELRNHETKLDVLVNVRRVTKFVLPFILMSCTYCLK